MDIFRWLLSQSYWPPRLPTELCFHFAQIRDCFYNTLLIQNVQYSPRRRRRPNMHLTCKPIRAHFLKMRFGGLFDSLPQKACQNASFKLSARLAPFLHKDFRKNGAKGFVRLKCALGTRTRQ